MTDEMLDLARANAAEAGVENVEFRQGLHRGHPARRQRRRRRDLQLRDQPVRPTSSRVIAEAARVLRPGGRFAVSDVIADPDMDEATRADMAAWTGCIAGALTEAEFRAARRPRPASVRSRSARPTACTSTPRRRSSARASRVSDDPPERSPDALPPLGARAVEPVGDRPLARCRAVEQRLRRGGRELVCGRSRR